MKIVFDGANQMRLLLLNCRGGEYLRSGDKMNPTVRLGKLFFESSRGVPALLPDSQLPRKARELSENCLPNLTIRFILSRSIWPPTICQDNNPMVRGLLRGLVHAWMNSVQKNVVDMEEMFQLLSQEPEVKVYI